MGNFPSADSRMVVSVTSESMSMKYMLTTGMRKLRIDRDYLIEHWHMIYIMSVVFVEFYV